MSKVYKYVELIGTSSEGYKEAIANAIAEAETMVGKMRWFEVIEQRGHVGEDGVAWYQVVMKIGHAS